MNGSCLWNLKSLYINPALSYTEKVNDIASELYSWGLPKLKSEYRLLQKNTIHKKDIKFALVVELAKSNLQY